MKKIRGYYTLLLCIAFSLFCIETQAQRTIETGTESLELVKIAELYKSVPNLSYQIWYRYADSSAPATLLDSSLISCKLAGGKSFITDSETEILDDGRNMLYLDKDDTVINVYPAQNHSIMQLPLLDSIFRVVHVSGMTVTNINDSVRILSITFNPGSNYQSYQITYDPGSFLISQIKYYTLNDGSFDLPSDHVLCTTITLSGYSISAIDPSVFNISRYVYYLNGQYYPQPAYQLYQVSANQ